VILHNADDKWEVMFKNDDFTFWYSGLSRLLVVQGQKIRNKETMGYTKPGEKIVLQMMDAETSVDPKPLLDCGR
ncbi:MAG TPA: hypothetical protein VI461_09920, partial [Chitinophagaceae bacterium]|nr:hypothetical protein [Chitinophagaceae bacterium]